MYHFIIILKTWPIVRDCSDIFLEDCSQNTDISEIKVLSQLKHDPRASRILAKIITRHSAEKRMNKFYKQANFKMGDSIYVVKNVQITRKRFHEPIKFVHFRFNRFSHYQPMCRKPLLTIKGKNKTSEVT
jgi:hypothetical protein